MADVKVFKFSLGKELPGKTYILKKIKISQGRLFEKDVFDITIKEVKRLLPEWPPE